MRTRSIRSTPPRRLRGTAPQLEFLEDRTAPALIPGITTIEGGLTQAENLHVVTANTSPGGNSIIAFQEIRGAHTHVFAEIVDHLGNVIGGQHSPPFGPSDDTDPSIGSDNAGNFVLSWTRFQTNGDKNVLAARFNSNGVMIGDVIKVAATASEENNSSVACAGNGSFVVTFTRVDANTGSDVFARRYSAAGQLLTTITVAHTTGKEFNAVVAVGRGTNPRFSVAYQIGFNIYLKRYSATGATLTSYSIAATSLKETQPSVAMDYAGNTVVSWQELGKYVWSARARKVNIGGVMEPVVEVQNGSYTLDLHSKSGGFTAISDMNTAVALDRTDGRFVVAYVQNFFHVGDFDRGTAYLRVYVAEVDSTGKVLHRLLVEKQADGGQAALPFLYTVAPGISIRQGDHLYTISYLKFADATHFGQIHRRAGLL